MYKIISFLFIQFIVLQSNAQLTYSGTWQGIILKKGMNLEGGNPIYFEFEIVNNLLDGTCRVESYNKEEFRIFKLGGKLDSNRFLNIYQKKLLKDSPKSSNLCLLNFKLEYNKNNGYLEGTYDSKCQEENGKIILYKSTFYFHDGPGPLQSHNWFDRFANDLKEGLSSPDKRLIELRNFKFDPIYFDHDKFEIKPEYHDYLRMMIRMVKSHSDIRIKITGHTDSNGSDKYNDRLSFNRAKALIQFFEKNGLEKSRFEIDFKGEKQPILSNRTFEGKKRNRRVDFTFI
jgi:OOP family OmpA-OmpF porin